MDPDRQYSRVNEWRRKLLYTISGMLIFETLTGLSILLLPFSVPNQVMVLFHTVVGLAFVIPFIWYQARHWSLYRTMRMSHVKLTGYFAMVATIVLVVSGLVLTHQAILGTRISYAWDLTHIVATFAFIASALPHLIVLLVRAFRTRASVAGAQIHAAAAAFRRGTMWVTVAGVALVVVGVFAHRPPELINEFPEDDGYLYGEDRPFAPSLATTNTGGAFDPRTLAGSESCGTSGCHSEILAEWQVSAHRYAAMDAAFQKVQQVMAEQNGAESTRYCGGCHDPISLFSGAKTLFTEDLTGQMGFQEGVSCIACHAIEESDVQGNANYTIRQPDRYMFEYSDRTVPRLVRDYLIRAYPRHHVEQLQHTLFKSPEFCASCHKQFIDEEINQVGWVQLQNQYDNWRKSRWNEPGNPEVTIECRECHMPLVASDDPASGDDLDYNRTPSDGKHRSHRFLGANQFMPLALDLPRAEEHARLTEQWLRGEIEIPEIAHKWKQGPAVPIEIVAPDVVHPGDPINLQVVVTNNKVGHDFPTGPLDIIQAWVEIQVTDQDGNVVFSSGQRDERHFIEPGSFMFKAEPVDQYGNLIDRHNLWEMVGVRYRRSLFPGFSDRAEFAFEYPALIRVGADSTAPLLDTDVGLTTPRRSDATLIVHARLLYRKADQFFLNFLFTEESGVTAPVTVMSEDEFTIRVERE